MLLGGSGEVPLHPGRASPATLHAPRQAKALGPPSGARTTTIPSSSQKTRGQVSELLINHGRGS